MKRIVRVVREEKPGRKWQTLFKRTWPAYEQWFLREGERARPTFASSRRALRRHMPELVPTWEKLCDLAGGGDRAARMLALYCPMPYMTGCSQVALADPEPLLIRNYDYRPDLWEAVIWVSAWNGRWTAAMSDSLWGVLDGINEDGLAVSLTFGGRRVIGDGFAITLILRYILEFCSTLADAEEVLRRVPRHMAYNATVIDAEGRFLTAFLAPDEVSIVRGLAVCTNHQEKIDWHEYVEATASLKRESFLHARLGLGHGPVPPVGGNELLLDFLQPPLFSRNYRGGHGTLYTAMHRPARRDALFIWPSHVCHVPLAQAQETSFEVDFASLPAAVGPPWAGGGLHAVSGLFV